MKYYVVTVQNNETQSVFAYSDYDSALAAYHSELGYRSEQRTSTLCILFREDGAVLCHEMWKKQETEQEES